MAWSQKFNESQLPEGLGSGILKSFTHTFTDATFTEDAEVFAIPETSGKAQIPVSASALFDINNAYTQAVVIELKYASANTNTLLSLVVPGTLNTGIVVSPGDTSGGLFAAPGQIKGFIGSPTDSAGAGTIKITIVYIEVDQLSTPLE